MSELIELEILPNGEIRMMYGDTTVPKVAEMIGARVTDVPRASNVEFEKTPHGDGWTVRAAHDPDLALRLVETEGDPDPKDPALRDVLASRIGQIALFSTREKAIEYEIANFWDLLPPGAACPVPKKKESK